VTKYSPRYEVTIGGTTYREAGGKVLSCKAETTVEGAAMAQVTMTEPFDSEMAEFRGGGVIEPGMDFEIACGFGDGPLTTQFVGKTRSIDTNFNMNQGGKISVTGYCKLHEMMRDVKDRTWKDKKVTDVVNEICGEYFSNVEIECDGCKRKRIHQQQTDYRCVRDMADDFGYEFFANYEDSPSCHFEPRTSLSKEPEKTLTYGDNFYEFDAAQSTAKQVKRCEVRYYDPKKEKEIVGSCEQNFSAPGMGEGKEVFRIACDSKEEADNIAKGKLAELSMGQVKGTAKCRGQPKIHAGDVVRLKGLGEKFDGKYYVTKATDKVGQQGYHTTFEVRDLPDDQSVGSGMIGDVVGDVVSGVAGEAAEEVGDVAGDVGNVAGDVGNVAGDVGNVAGAVGADGVASAAGDVGNVAGDVGDVAGDVQQGAEMVASGQIPPVGELEKLGGGGVGDTVGDII